MFDIGISSTATNFALGSFTFLRSPQTKARLALESPVSEAEKFKAFPPEAQKAILIAFDREQTERHAWLKTQQKNDHEFNLQSEKHFSVWKMTGTIAGFTIIVLAMFFGVWLIKSGASAFGASLIITAIAGLIGTAVYGHYAKSIEAAQKRDNTQAVVPTNPN